MKRLISYLIVVLTPILILFLIFLTTSCMWRTDMYSSYESKAHSFRIYLEQEYPLAVIKRINKPDVISNGYYIFMIYDCSITGKKIMYEYKWDDKPKKPNFVLVANCDQGGETYRYLNRYL